MKIHHTDNETPTKSDDLGWNISLEHLFLKYFLDPGMTEWLKVHGTAELVIHMDVHSCTVFIH